MYTHTYIFNTYVFFSVLHLKYNHTTNSNIINRKDDSLLHYERVKTAPSTWLQSLAPQNSHSDVSRNMALLICYTGFQNWQCSQGYARWHHSTSQCRLLDTFLTEKIWPGLDVNLTFRDNYGSIRKTLSSHCSVMVIPCKGFCLLLCKTHTIGRFTRTSWHHQTKMKGMVSLSCTHNQQ